MRRSRKRGHGQPCHQSFINRSAQAISRSTPGTWSRNAVLRFLCVNGSRRELLHPTLAAAMAQDAGPRDERRKKHDSSFLSVSEAVSK